MINSSKEFIQSVLYNDLLDLSDENITDEEISILSEIFKQHPEIDYLDLSDNEIEDSGVTELINLLHETKISELNLSWNNLTKESILLLKKFLEESNTVQKINLNHNQVLLKEKELPIGNLSMNKDSDGDISIDSTEFNDIESILLGEDVI